MACLANSLLFSAFIDLEIFEVHFDCARSQNRLGASGCSSRLRSRRCGAVPMFGLGGHFSWQVQGKPPFLVVQSRLFVAGEGDRSSFTSMCRFRGRCKTLDMAVFDFVASAVKCHLSTCGSFQDSWGSLERKLCFGILLLFLEVPLLRSAMAGLRDVNLEVQNAWQAWQAHHYVNLEFHVLLNRYFDKSGHRVPFHTEKHDRYGDHPISSFSTGAGSVLLIRPAAKCKKYPRPCMAVFQPVGSVLVMG